jgi:hypothetical protein
VPIYIHPALPHAAVIEAYYKDYVQSATHEPEADPAIRKELKYLS